MSVNNPLSQYQQTQLNTITPGKLLVMTFDAALRFAGIAAEKMKERKLAEQSANITKVQNIVLELISSLDMSVDRQLASNLSSIYSYVFDRLTQANLRDDHKALDEATQILSELRDTWAEAERLVRTGAPAVMEAAAA